MIKDINKKTNNNNNDKMHVCLIMGVKFCCIKLPFHNQCVLFQITEQSCFLKGVQVRPRATGVIVRVPGPVITKFI